MKKIVLLVAVAVLALVFTSCNFTGTSLSGTHWRNQAAGSGFGYHFTSESAGAWEIGVLGSWGDGSSFSYTWDAVSGIGYYSYTYTATADLIAYGSQFTVNGNTLTQGGTAYTYAP